MGKEYILGWDVAQKQDKTALMLWRRNPTITDGKVFEFLDLVFMQEMEAIAYTEQCKVVAGLLDKKQLKCNTDLVIDGTGIGQAVVDIMRSYRLDPIPVVFTGGLAVSVKYSDAGRRFSGAEFKGLRTVGEICVPKVDMIHAAKLCLEQNRVRIAGDVKGADEFKKQLIHFTGKVNDRGYASFGNDAVAKHDDWVACFIMCCWYAGYSREQKTECRLCDVAEQCYSWNPLGEFDF